MGDRSDAAAGIFPKTCRRSMALHARWRRWFDQAGIFGLNSAGLYRLNLKAADARPMPAYSADRLAQLKNEYEFAAKGPSGLRYGYVRTG